MKIQNLKTSDLQALSIQLLDDIADIKNQLDRKQRYTDLELAWRKKAMCSKRGKSATLQAVWAELSLRKKKKKAESACLKNEFDAAFINEAKKVLHGSVFDLIIQKVQSRW